MANKTVNVTVAGATFDLLTNAADFVGVVKKAVADGWQPGTDIPAVIAAAVHDMGGIVGNLGEVSAELGATDKGPFSAAVAIGGAAVVAKALG